MRIWVVNAQENPPLKRSISGRRLWRSNTLCEHLSDRGHEVVRWRSSFSHQKKAQLVGDSILIEDEGYSHQYIKAASYKSHVGWPRTKSHQDLAREFTRLAKCKVQPDVIHFCNVPLELSNACASFAHEIGIPSIVDVRDLWPDSYANVLPGPLIWSKPVIEYGLRNWLPRVAQTYKMATSVTAITAPILDWALQKIPREVGPLDAVFPMAYPAFVTKEGVAERRRIRNKINVPEDATIAVYAGNIGFQTDFDTIVRTAKRLSEDESSPYFVIAGSGPRVEDLRIASDGIWNLRVVGWLEGPDLTSLLATASIGLVGFFNLDDYRISYPNKFAEYLSFGLAIVCGTSGLMEDAVRAHNCGVLYPSGNDEHAARAIRHMTRADILSFGNNAKRLHREKFSSDVVYSAMADHVEKVYEEGKGQIRV